MITRKHPVSARATARIISRILRENGFKKSNRKNSGEGYYAWAFRNSARASYHLPWSRDPEAQKSNETASESKIAQMREVLFELGYVSTEPHEIVIECRES